MRKFIFYLAMLIFVALQLPGQDISGFWKGKIEAKYPTAEHTYNLALNLLLDRTIGDTTAVYYGRFVTYNKKYPAVTDTSYVWVNLHLRTLVVEYSIGIYLNDRMQTMRRYESPSRGYLTLEKGFASIKGDFTDYIPGKMHVELNKEPGSVHDTTANAISAYLKPTFLVKKNVSYSATSHQNNRVNYLENGVEGKLQIPIANLSRLPVNGSIAIYPREKSGDYSQPLMFKMRWDEKMRSSFYDSLSILPAGSTTMDIAVFPTRRLPPDSIALHIEIRDFLTDKKYFDTVFVKTKTIVKSVIVVKKEDQNSARYSIIGKFYGFTEGTIQDAKRQLDSLVERGDKKAMMWKAYFIGVGAFEYARVNLTAKYLSRGIGQFLLPEAMSGDRECIFLMKVYYDMRWFNTDEERENQNLFDRLLMEADYGPYECAYGILTVKSTDPKNRKSGLQLNEMYGESARKHISNAYLKGGCKRAAVLLAGLYADGVFVEKDPNKAITLCQDYFPKNDPEALRVMAKIYLDSDNKEYDPTKGRELAVLAIKHGSVGAMALLGNYLSFSEDAEEEDVTQGVKYITRAAEMGHRPSMFTIGILALAEQVKKDGDRFYWLERSAQAGDPHIMQLLAKIYNDSVDNIPLMVRGRYWAAQAKNLLPLESWETKDAQEFWDSFFFTLMDIMDDANTKVGVESIRVPLANGLGSELIKKPVYKGLGWAAVDKGFNLLFDKLQRDADNQKRSKVANKFMLIQQNSGHSVYGGTINCRVADSIQVKKGQALSFNVSGQINLFDNKYCYADGIDNNFKERRIANFNSGAFMVRSGKGPWTYIGRNGRYVVPENGFLHIAINDADCSKTKNYFDFEMEVDQ